MRRRHLYPRGDDLPPVLGAQPEVSSRIDGARSMSLIRSCLMQVRGVWASSIVLVLVVVLTGCANSHVSKPPKATPPTTPILGLTPRTFHLHIGQGTSGTSSDLAGLTYIGVESLDFPVPPPTPSVDPGPGRELAVAQVDLCRNQAPLVVDLTDFTLRFPNGDALIPVFSIHDPNYRFDAKTPDLKDVMDRLRMDRCGKGYLTFDIGAGSVPSYIEFQPLLPPYTYQWTFSSN